MKLDDIEVPGERQAEERAWRAVATAYDATERAPSRRRRLGVRLTLAATAAAIAIAGMALTPPGEALADWLARTVGVEKPRPEVAASVGLPGPGRLLIGTPRGLYTVDRGGRRHRLGDWQEGAFSPRGRFVAATRDRTLAALDLAGAVRWSLRRPFALSQPVWAPDGLHVAYRSGEGLRVVGGDGSRDRFLAGPMGAAEPVWLDARTIAYAVGGRVNTVDVVNGRAGWTSKRGRPVRRLVAGGRFVLAVATHDVRVLLARDGRTSLVRAAPRGAEFVAAATGGNRLALVRHDAEHGLSHIELSPIGAAGAGRREAPSLPGRIADPVFSPDGRWLLLGWKVADEWLFLSTPTAGRVAAVPSVGKRLSPIAPGRWAFPRVLGWAPAP